MKHSILLKSAIIVICIVSGMLVFAYLKSTEVSNSSHQETIEL